MTALDGTLEKLCREIGHPYQPYLDESPVFLVTYVCQLLHQVRDAARRHCRPDAVRNIAPHYLTSDLAEMFYASFYYPTVVSHDGALKMAANHANSVIDAIDSDDGWPTCPWLNALKGCALAIGFGLERPCSTRWPAQAGDNVASLVLGNHGFHNREAHALRRGWVHGVFSKVAQTVPPFGTPTPESLKGSQP